MPTGFTINGTDLDKGPLIPKTYLMDYYPELVETYRFGGIWSWGRNHLGQLGTNDITDRSTPVQILGAGATWSKVSCTGSFTIGLKSDGTLWGWGSNNVGQLGTNNITSRSSPVQVVGSSTTWKKIAAGNGFCMGIKDDGTLWTWGYNHAGQLGTFDTVNRSSPIQTSTGGTNWFQASGGQYFAAAIKTDGTLWTWGHNSVGSLGIGIPGGTRSSPIQVSGTGWKFVNCGDMHASAIKSDGTLWTWGYNVAGQLGTNDQTDRSDPVQTVAGGTNWKTVSCGNLHTVAIKNDGTLWSWGAGQSGEMGDNTNVSKSSPVQTVAGGTNWYKAEAGYHTIAIKTDGTLWTWGRNDYGNIGAGSATIDPSSPVQILAGSTSWREIAASDEFTSAAIRDDSQDFV